VKCVANDRWVHQADNESHEKAVVCVGGGKLPGADKGPLVSLQ
jgi:hypothetical protein